MSEVKEPKEEKGKKGKKGKGGKKKKLPVLIVLVLVLAGGGFFGMKMSKGKAEVEVPPLKLGDDAHVVTLGEFMVNSSGGTVLVKATVLLHLADGASLFGEGGGHGTGPPPEALAPYVDAIREVLSSQSISDLSSGSGEKKLKAEIAKKVNELYSDRHPEEVKKLPKLGKEDDGSKWQSDKGPVLVVYLTELIWA